jgi:transposase
LSGFKEHESQQALHCNDIIITTGDKEKVIPVPILEWNNFGKNMCIDEKQIGDDMHTIISNRDSGKIALLARTLKYEYLRQLLPQENLICRNVETLTRDLSKLYRRVGDYSFFNAYHIADKFHIVKNLLDSVQDVRVRYRQEELRKRRLEYDKHKLAEKERRKHCKEQNIPFKPNRFNYREKTLSSGETALEVLSRGRYILYKYEQDWTPTQQYRAKVLFDYYPQIKTAYTLACDFRKWYNRDKDISIYGKLEKNSRLKEWYKQVENSDIDELLNFKSMVERNEEEVLNYFVKGHTNALAENINSRIQQFISANKGTRDIDFVYFKIKKMFAQNISGTSK